MPDNGERALDPRERSNSERGPGTGSEGWILQEIVAEVNRVRGSSFTHGDMTDPRRNIAAATAYLQIRIDRAGGDVAKGLNGYGTGSGYSNSILAAERDLNANPSRGEAVLKQDIGP